MRHRNLFEQSFFLLARSLHNTHDDSNNHKNLDIEHFYDSHAGQDLDKLIEVVRNPDNAFSIPISPYMPLSYRTKLHSIRGAFW